jgi:two-component system, NtrC family, sensor histidine kinase HydH
MPGKQRTVLCVDDNADFVDNLREILGDVGYVVRAASSCQQAVEQAATSFDVALVDVRLPDGDGIALTGRLRAIAPDAQFIMLTGFATLESAAAAVRAGAWAYLMKPCATPDLLMTVEQAMRHVAILEEKRDFQRRAQVAEKLAAIGTLTAGLSHEIKNPLNAAALQLAVLERRVRRLPADAQPPLSEPLKLVQDEIIRLNRVLEEFLQFARPREIYPVPVELSAVLSRVADLMGPEAERVQVNLERQFTAPLMMTGDEGRLQQAVVNLVLNAIQATPPGGFVRLQAETQGREVHLLVEDSGSGIPDDVRRHIFEPFFTTKAGGSGIGLPLVHSIVEQHQGTIAVEPRAEGGTCFHLQFPLRVEST